MRTSYQRVVKYKALLFNNSRAFVCNNEVLAPYISISNLGASAILSKIDAGK
ncbi:hypothetical protein SAMN04487890_11439 [Mucilaginibacter polytrichastri]|nr:hypothetical protein SAMN04487890_11439 [Mucilaginibacter polytrichastri]